MTKENSYQKNMKMVSLSPSSLQIFGSNSSSTLSLVKFKALLQTLILSLAKAISRAKTTAFHILKHANHQSLIAMRKNKNKLLFGSFRLHYNWCSSSSHVTPVPVTWDDLGGIGDGGGGGGGDQLSGYLQWLEEREGKGEKGCGNEIDELAEIFIARSHEKFRLEKQESYRRFQEIMARSL